MRIRVGLGGLVLVVVLVLLVCFVGVGELRLVVDSLGFGFGVVFGRHIGDASGYGRLAKAVVVRLIMVAFDLCETYEGEHGRQNAQAEAEKAQSERELTIVE